MASDAQFVKSTVNWNQVSILINLKTVRKKYAY